jgi:putative addiction module component (TIGR02574 family)
VRHRTPAAIGRGGHRRARRSVRGAISALSLAEKVELRDYIDHSIAARGPVLTAHQKATVRARAAELDADPSLGIPWEEVNAELAAEFG